MVKVAIIGGKLQGTEAAYLAKKAGYSSLLIDIDKEAPARGIADFFLCTDVCKKEESLLQTLREMDFVLPAMENEDVLRALEEIARSEPDICIAFDFDAYRTSSSKLESDKLFHENNIPSPQYYPEGESPFIAKPSGGSGSDGVRYLASPEEVRTFTETKRIEAEKEEGAECREWIVQEYLEGRSYSIEVIGVPGHYRTYQVTEIHMDDVYDCRKVTCPCPELSAEVIEKFSALATELAELVNLRGIMDVEIILCEGKNTRERLKVLEIDARIPSQTPAAIYHSTGINLLTELYSLFCLPEGDWQKQSTAQPAYQRQWPAAYEHLVLDGSGEIREMGEHVMSDCSSLSLYENIWNSDVAMSDYKDGDASFRGTFINSAEDLAGLEEKRKNVRQALKELQVQIGSENG